MKDDVDHVEYYPAGEGGSEKIFDGKQVKEAG
jgi:hypothetical protein